MIFTVAGLFGMGLYFEQVTEQTSTLSLSAFLDEETRDVYEQAVNHTFMYQLIDGTLDKEHRRQYLFDLRGVYEVLERELLLSCNHKHVKSIWFEDLSRAKAIGDELANLPSAKPLTLSTVADEYIDYLEFLGRQDPTLLIGHAYACYLRDRDPGIFIKSLRPQHHSLDEFKRLFKGYMNQLVLTEKERADILRQTRLAFEYAYRIFDEALQTSI